MVFYGQVKSVSVKPSKDGAMLTVQIDSMVTGNVVAQAARLLMEKAKVQIDKEQMELPGTEEAST